MNIGLYPNLVSKTGNVDENPASPTPINIAHVDNLTISGNTVPMTGGGYMAAVDGGCKISVSGNSFPGGGAELYTVNSITCC